MGRKLASLDAGRFLIVEAFDHQALYGHDKQVPRKASMPESLVVYDELGAGAGQCVGISEGREAGMPFYPEHVPIDAYISAILDEIELTTSLDVVE
ncbi:EutN/CcmL family microcompartment protein [Poriferisphaera sp. WC338]|uniref:EutN/CcmL family microcompartment protein n=1 Tax=Poriferisphaera sp. WC338 TaxID=3425129 RepID=UPI003D81904F